MKNIRSFFLLPFFVIASMACSQSSLKMKHTETVKHLDINRYMGRWYEIARFDHRFERGMQGVTANYRLLPNGMVEVVNSGYQDSLTGKFKQVKGKAKQPDANDPGKLKVSFFLWFYADYNVLELDDNYQYALIGSSSDKYLWILSRTPQLRQEILEMLLQKARLLGYDIGKLIFVEQKR